MSASPDVSVVIINKDEREIAQTLVALAGHATRLRTEVIVVDASEGRLDDLRELVPGTTWLDFRASSPGRITIPEQRNVGVGLAQAPVVVFIDAGCLPDAGWLDALVEPILAGRESVTVGDTRWLGAAANYTAKPSPDGSYLDEAPTINMAFTREAFAAVGGFDESFDYGSDIDFTWRLRESGFPLAYVPSAQISAHGGTALRQLRRAFQYGRARAHLYDKHRSEWRHVLRRDPVAAIYPIYLLGLPLTALRAMRWYPLLLVIPAIRAHEHRARTVLDHLAFGLGVLDFLRSRLRR